MSDRPPFKPILVAEDGKLRALSRFSANRLRVVEAILKPSQLQIPEERRGELIAYLNASEKAVTEFIEKYRRIIPSTLVQPISNIGPDASAKLGIGFDDLIDINQGGYRSDDARFYETLGEVNQDDSYAEEEFGAPRALALALKAKGMDYEAVIHPLVADSILRTYAGEGINLPIQWLDDVDPVILKGAIEFANKHGRVNNPAEDECKDDSIERDQLVALSYDPQYRSLKDLLRLIVGQVPTLK